MRELITLLENFERTQLTESRGIGARLPGDPFVNTTNPDDTATMFSVDFYPGPTEDISIDKLHAIYTSVTNKLIKQNIALVSVKPSFTNKSKAFGVAILDRSNGQKIAFIKPFNEVKPDNALYAWDNQTGLEGYKYSSKAASKNTMKIQASDVLSNLDNITPQDILADVIAKYGKQHTLSKVAAHITSGANLPASFPAASDIPFEAFRDFFMEMMQPVALINGQFTGTASSLNNGDFSSYNISFNKEKNGGLSDSILIGGNGPDTIRVSSKGASGANAAASNLAKVAADLHENAPNIAKKHKKIIDMITRIVSDGQWESPLTLGKEFSIITEEDAEVIRGLRKIPPIAVSKIKTILTPNLHKLVMKERLTKSGDQVEVLPYPTLTAAVAHAVARVVNETDDFSKAACDILNYGLLVQVYTKVSAADDKWRVGIFEAKYPSTETTHVWFDAGKNYFNTQCKGNFTFEIEKNGKPAPSETTTSSSIPVGDDSEYEAKLQHVIDPHLNLRPVGATDVDVKPRGKRVSPPRDLRK